MMMMMMMDQLHTHLIQSRSKMVDKLMCSLGQICVVSVLYWEGRNGTIAIQIHYNVNLVIMTSIKCISVKMI